MRIAFTPDEEIGRGADHFDVARFGAVCAYTLDGGGRGELEFESFSADAITVTFKGFNTHPGYAKGRMVNAIRVAADFVARLPREHDVAGDDRRLRGLSASVPDARARRSHQRQSARARFRDRAAEGQGSAASSSSRARRGAAASRVIAWNSRSRNRIATCAKCSNSIRASSTTRARRFGSPGMEPIERPIRGGTDGSRLSFMGLPTPNLFAGEHNFHSRLEWVVGPGHGQGGRSDREAVRDLGRVVYGRGAIGPRCTKLGGRA